jgi:hypothetical protein
LSNGSIEVTAPDEPTCVGAPFRKHDIGRNAPAHALDHFLRRASLVTSSQIDTLDFEHETKFQTRKPRSDFEQACERSELVLCIIHKPARAGVLCIIPIN